MFSENPNYDPVDITYLASRPSAGTWGLRFASGLKSERRQVLMRWAVAYVTSPPALFVLSLGIAGLISALSQYIVLKQVEKAVPELANQVGGFAGEVVDFLNNSSSKFAASTNNVMQGVSDELNKEISGWLTNSTQSLNDTLTVFSDTMQKGIDQYVKGTIMEKPAVEIIKCLIGLKIEALQKGLAWVHENAQISFPQIPADTFSLGALSSLNDDKSDSFLADPESASSDMITDTLFKMSKKWQEGLSTEAAISGGVVLIWVLVLLIALVRTGSLWWGLDKVRGDGGGQGTNFSGGQLPVAAPAVGALPPSYISSRQANPGPESDPENDDHGMNYPSQTYNRHSGPETFRLGRVSSRRITPPPIAPGGWIDEKKRGHITDDNY